MAFADSAQRVIEVMHSPMGTELVDPSVHH